MFTRYVLLFFVWRNANITKNSIQLKFYYKKKEISITSREPSDVFEYVLNTMSIVAQNWFKRIQSGIFDVKDKAYSGRPLTLIHTRSILLLTIGSRSIY